MKKFYAKIVEAFKDKFTDDFTVFNIFFEESDPETGGEEGSKGCHHPNKRPLYGGI